jgi:hypothetical protein
MVAEPHRPCYSFTKNGWSSQAWHTVGHQGITILAVVLAFSLSCAVAAWLQSSTTSNRY